MLAILGPSMHCHMNKLCRLMFILMFYCFTYAVVVGFVRLGDYLINNVTIVIHFVSCVPVLNSWLICEFNWLLYVRSLTFLKY